MEEKRRDFTGTPPPQPPAASSDGTPSEQPTSRRRGGGQKRKSVSINSGGNSSAPLTISSKRQTREKPSAVPFTPIHMNGPCTRARLQPYNINSSSEVAALKRESEAREAAAKAEEMIRVRENWQALDAKIEADYEAIRSRDANVHVVPCHAGWFSWSKIHPLEETMLPSFFNGKSESRTSNLYMDIRNWLMKKFHGNPNQQIELKHLDEIKIGDLDARKEVMEFLDYWGLINYHPFPQQEPSAMIVDANDDKDKTGKTDSLVEKLFQFEPVQSLPPLIPKFDMEMPAVSSGFFPESIANELVKSEDPHVEYHCNSCAADCSRKRYHCQKQADFDLCADCFNNEKFGSNMSPSDFILMEPVESGGASGGKWTDQETLLLLEALELFRDNWSEIAEHVATKTKAQCILHFVQMPIEDAFFNHDERSNDVSKENENPVSADTEDSASKVDQDSRATVKDALEKTESQDGTTVNQDSSPMINTLKTNEVGGLDNDPGVGENFALKALKEAFEAVGSLPSPGERLSFSEAGNPVMALAAFLVRLVEPNTATASARNLLKSLSGSYSGDQLAARHCFPLEDPPDDSKNLANSERASTETGEHEGPKDKIKQAEKHEETPDSVVDGNSLHEGENDGKKDPTHGECDGEKDSASDDQEPVASTSSDIASKSNTVKENDEIVKENGEMVTAAKAQPVDEPSSSIVQNEPTPKDAEVSVVSASPKELQSHSAKESEGGDSSGEASQFIGHPKDDDTTAVSGNKEPDSMVIPNPNKEPDSTVISNPVSEKECNTGDKESKEHSAEKKDPLRTKNDLDIDKKLKQAAVTTLSAAAVKAKLLADQEEDQILQLSTFLIEKQLFKLEAKLAFFSDMENVVMRVKEQLDRSKQRLFHERAQIIATRFGMSATGRPPSQAVPPNRASSTFPNSAPRPVMGANSLRPPFPRPMMAANPTLGTAESSFEANTDKLS